MQQSNTISKLNLNKKTGLLSTSALALASLLLMSSPALADPANSWDYDTVLGGNVAKDVTTPGLTNITVNGGNGYVEGNASIYKNHTVNVTGDSGKTFAYKDNRDNITSTLNGALNSNMRIVIIDKDGLFFTNNAVIDTQSLIATTGDIAVDDVMGDNNILNIYNLSKNAIINKGQITAADQVALVSKNIINDGDIVAAEIGGQVLLLTPDQVSLDLDGEHTEVDTYKKGIILNTGSVTVAEAGLAAFVSPFVSNNGVISAKAGTAVIAAGETVTLDMYGDGLVEVAVDGALKDALIHNKGTIEAEGGVVNITAKAAKHTIENIINNEGLITASSASVQGGKIILSGGAEGTIANQGQIETSQGGSIEISGERFVQNESLANAIARKVFKQKPTPPSVNGGDIEITTTGNVGIYDGEVNAHGGNITIDNDGVFYSASANTLKTSGEGEIALRQNAGFGASLQNAIDAVDNTGTGRNTITVGAGEFSAITVDHANMTLQGQGADTVINPNSPGITVIADNAVIDGFAVSGLNDPAILVDNADNVSILNNIITGATTTYGVKIVKSHNATVQGNDIQNVVTGGIYAENSNNLVIDDNYVYNTRTGIQVMKGVNAAITNNTVDTTTAGTRLGDGIHVDGTNGALIDGNTVLNTRDDGIHVARTKGHVDVTNNIITNAGNKSSDLGNGIEIYKLFGSANVSDNIVTDSEDDGIVIKLSDSNAGPFVVTNNVVDISGMNGIFVDRNASVVSGNQVSNSKLTGISISNSNGVEVEGNTVTTAKLDGILLQDSDSAIVSLNDVSEVGEHGINIVSSDYVTTSGNLVTGATTKNGINILNSYANLISGNTVSGTLLDGIFIDNSEMANVLGNTVTSVNGNGIGLNFAQFANVYGNTISGAPTKHGVNVFKSDDAYVGYNTISDVTLNGVHLATSLRANVDGNTITSVSGHGVYVDQSHDAVVNANIISGAPTQNAIFVNRAHNVDVTNNNIQNILNVAIYGERSDNLFIDGNDIYNPKTGIDIRRGSNITITNNTVDKTFGGNKYADGVRLENSNGGLIADNIISNTNDDGIYLGDTTGHFVISGNTITNAGFKTQDNGNGIEFLGVFGTVDVLNNNVNKTKHFGIWGNKSENGSGSFNVDGNTVENAGTHGIYVDRFASSVSNNIVNNSKLHGIWIEEANDNATIFNNSISNSGQHGLLVGGALNQNVVLKSNVFVDNGKSGNFAQARFESGIIDISDLVNPNSFTTTFVAPSVAMQFDDVNGYTLGKLAIAGNTLGATSFTGYTGAGNFYVRFEDGAILDPVSGNPIVIDGLNASFDGVVPATTGGVLPQATYDFIEDRLFDADDILLNGRGQIFIGTVPADEEASLFNIQNFQDFFREQTVDEPVGTTASLTITGLPRVGNFAQQNFDNPADIEPQAGGETSPENIEPQAGETTQDNAQFTCLNDVVNNLGSGNVTYNFGGTLNDSIVGASGCQSDVI